MPELCLLQVRLLPIQELTSHFSRVLLGRVSAYSSLLGAQIDSVKAAHETEFSPAVNCPSAVSNTKAATRRTRAAERIGLKRLAEPELGGPVERSRCKSAGLFQPTCAASDRAAGRIGQ